MILPSQKWLSEELIQQRVRQIQQDVLAHSRHLRELDFTSIHPRDLEFLFGAYDKRFFAGLCRSALEERRLHFRLSPRMTRAGGKTARFTTRTGEVSDQLLPSIPGIGRFSGRTLRTTGAGGSPRKSGKT